MVFVGRDIPDAPGGGAALASLVLREVAKMFHFGRREFFFRKLPQSKIKDF